MFNNSVKFGSKLNIAIVILLLFSLFTKNPLHTFLAILFVPISAKLLWKQNETPILFFALLMQWTQVSVKVFQADYLGEEMQNMYNYPMHIESAFFLSLASITTISFGIFLMIRNFKTLPFSVVREQLLVYDHKKITIIYSSSILFVILLLKYAFLISGLQQFISKIVDFKWSIFFVFSLLTFLKNSGKKIFFTIVAIEVILGFTGFFSNFKEFFFILIICYLFYKQRLKISEYVLVCFTFLIVFNLMIVWQSVKGEYRSYVSGGAINQTVNVSREDALNKLSDIVADVDTVVYANGFTGLIDRASYIDFFSATQAYVPTVVQHENGQLWKDAILHIFTPRLLFPNKAVIDDSEKTRKYTGLNFSGAEQGTSISLGYVAETYVDFGNLIMFIPLFILGLVIGLIYKFIMTKSYNALWGHALIVPLFFQINKFEIALEKIIGGLIAYFIVYLILRKVFIKKIQIDVTEKNILAK